MIIKKIPIKYDVDNINLAELIWQSTGKVFPVYWTPSSRTLKIDADLTPEELTKIKADFLAAVEEIEDL